MKLNSAPIACIPLVMVLATCRGPIVIENKASADVTPTEEIAPAVMVTNAAVGKPLTASCPPNDMYPAKGVKSLVDGKMGSEYYEDAEWMGWWYEDKAFEATIDLGKSVAIKELGVHTLASTESWIFHPRKVEFELSDDGKTFKKVATIKPTKDELENEEPNTKILKASNLKARARFIRVRVERYGELPQWHTAHGGADGYDGQAWLFIDEILVNPK